MLQSTVLIFNGSIKLYKEQNSKRARTRTRVIERSFLITLHSIYNSTRLAMFVVTLHGETVVIDFCPPFLGLPSLYGVQCGKETTVAVRNEMGFFLRPSANVTKRNGKYFAACIIKNVKKEPLTVQKKWPSYQKKKLKKKSLEFLLFH